jgi:ABC-type uncharacterized transport system permease subunit
MNLLPRLSRHEDLLLLGAVTTYLVAMLLLWSRLFFAADEPLHTETRPWYGSAGGLSRALLWGGAILHLLALAGQGSALFSIRAGVAGLFGWILVLAYLLVGQRLGRRTLGAFVTPVALLAALYSLTAPLLHRATPRAEQLESQWLVIHVMMILVSYVALAFAFAASLVYLLQESLLKRKRLTGLWQRLPSLQVADDLIYRATSFGLAMLTLGLFSGVLWFQRHQPNYAPLHDPKVLFSLVTWLVFALYLAARLWLGWRGRRTNLVVVCGFLLLVASFFGAPHVLSGITR